MTVVVAMWPRSLAFEEESCIRGGVLENGEQVNLGAHLRAAESTSEKSSSQSKRLVYEYTRAEMAA